MERSDDMSPLRGSSSSDRFPNADALGYLDFTAPRCPTRLRSDADARRRVKQLCPRLGRGKAAVNDAAAQAVATLMRAEARRGGFVVQVA